MPRRGKKFLSKGKGARGGNPGPRPTATGSTQACAPAGRAFMLVCLSAPREHKTRIKEHLPTNDVVETPCKFHSSSCPRFEARANQSKHVLGENRVQNQAGVRTAELMEALTRAQAGQTSDGDRSSPAARQLQIHPWKRLLGNGYRLRHHHSTMQGMCKLSL